MIKTVSNISLALFKKKNNELILSNFNTNACISIIGYDLDEANLKPKINDNVWKRSIQFQFNDTEQDFNFTDEKGVQKKQIEDLIKFICKLHLEDEEFDLIIHCFAGISRSAAVAKFVNDIFDLKIKYYDELFFYNHSLYKLLKRYFWN